MPSCELHTCELHTCELHTCELHTCVLKTEAKQMQLSLWGGEGQVLSFHRLLSHTGASHVSPTYTLYTGTNTKIHNTYTKIQSHTQGPAMCHQHRAQAQIQKYITDEYFCTAYIYVLHTFALHTCVMLTCIVYTCVVNACLLHNFAK